MNSECSNSGKIAALVCILLIIMVGFGFPGMMLVDKPANSQATYAAGWQEGCQSGITANAPIRALLTAQPFVRSVDTRDALYKEGWNEGYTSCRFNQAAWCQALEVLIIVLALLCTRFRREDKV